MLAELQQKILRAKGDYYRAEEAYRTATTEQEKVLANEMAKRAHHEANILRAQMEGMGVAPSNYSKDTTIKDAYKTFASQKARDIINSMQGQYSVNSDQYYHDKYIEARVRGFSDKEAKRFADNQAARYKANRATYLDNIFNAHGFNGAAISKEGVRYLAQLFRENPEIYQIYKDMLPNPREAYARQNTIDFKNLDQKHNLERMAKAHGYNLKSLDRQQIHALEKMARAYENSINLAGINNDYARGLAQLQSSLGINASDAKKAVDQQYYVNPIQESYDGFYAIAKQTGLSDEAVQQLAAITTINSKTPKQANNAISPDKQIGAWTGVLNALNNRRKGLVEQDQYGTNPAIQNQIQDIDAQIAEIYSQIQGLSAIQYTVPKFTGDWNKDRLIVDSLRAEGQRRGLTWQQIKQAVYEQILADTRNQKYARGRQV